jgi:hypothetical protein
MSIRTVIEINHDYMHDFENHPEWWAELIAALKRSDLNRGLNDGETPTMIPGVRALGQRHHSFKLKLEVK